MTNLGSLQFFPVHRRWFVEELPWGAEISFLSLGLDATRGRVVRPDVLLTVGRAVLAGALETERDDVALNFRSTGSITEIFRMERLKWYAGASLISTTAQPPRLAANTGSDNIIKSLVMRLRDSLRAESMDHLLIRVRFRVGSGLR